METIAITKIDDQLGIKFPISVSKKLKMKEGQSIILTTLDNRIDLQLNDDSKLDEILEKINPANLHAEIETKHQVGNEVW